MDETEKVAARNRWWAARCDMEEARAALAYMQKKFDAAQVEYVSASEELERVTATPTPTDE